jgi:sec-independent protein translocase protein TatA
MFFLEDLSPPKVLLVLAIALLLFGPRKLPELGSSLGQAIRGFKHGLIGASAESSDSERR